MGQGAAETMIVHKFDDRAAWLEGRRKGLGGSDVPAILGISPWRTPLQVWSDKVGLAADGEDSYVLRRGSHMEPLLWRELEREVKGLTAKPQSLVIIEGAEPWMRYSPDAFLSLIAGDNYEEALGEGKSHPRGASEWAEGAPPHVVAQVQWGMHVTGFDVAYVAVDLGVDFKWQRIEKDPAWWRANEAALREFWDRVVREEPPQPTSDEGDRAILARMWPKEDPGKAMALPPEMVEVADRLLELEADKKIVDDQIEQARNELRAAIGDHETALLPGGGGFRLRTESRPKMVRDASGATTSTRVLRRFAAKER